MIKIAICEDEEIFRSQAITALQTYEKENALEFMLIEYVSGEEFLEKGAVEEVLLLDIEMTGMDGIALKNHLQEIKSRTKILFLTSHEEFMVPAFGKQVYGFLKKPLDYDELAKYLQTIIRDVQEEDTEKSILITTILDERVSVKISEIIYIKVEDKYSLLVTAQGDFCVRKPLNTWEEELGNSLFLRCHKSFLVNMDHIKKDKLKIVMDNGFEIAVPRGKKRQVSEQYQKFVQKKLFL